MTTPLDGSAATASHSDDLRAKQPGSPDLLDLIKVKPDAGKDLMCTAGRVSDDGGPLPDVAVEMSSATSSVAPQRPAISSEYFVQAGGTDDPHGKALHNK